MRPAGAAVRWLAKLSVRKDSAEEVGADTDVLAQSDTQDLSITVSAALAITTNSLPDAREGDSYGRTLQRSGGVAPFTWSVTPALPDGLNLEESTGRISGVPADGTAGNYTFTVQDSSTPTPQTASKLLGLRIRD